MGARTTHSRLIPRAVGLIAYAALIIACSSPYAASVGGRDAAASTPGTGSDAGAPSSDAARTDPDAEGGAPSDCAGVALCLRFDGVDPPGVNVQKGTGTHETQAGDAISPPSALHASAGSGDYAGLQWGTAEKATAGAVVSVRLAFKVTSIGTATALPMVAFLKIGAVTLHVSLEPPTNTVILLWTNQNDQEISRGNLTTYQSSAWNQLSFVVSESGAAAAPGETVIAAAPGTFSGDIGIALGAVSYRASDSTVFSVLIDDVSIKISK